MSLRLVLGRAGSGKTRRCLEEVGGLLALSSQGPPLIILVPEQATFQMERSLVQHLGVKGTIRAQVLSFRRLAWRVLAEAGGAARPHVSELGKRMILRRVLEHHKEKLLVFQKSARQPGFEESLSRLLSEFKSYCVSSEQLRQAVRKMNGSSASSPQLAEKLEDILLLFTQMDDYLQGRYTDPDDYLKLLAERIPHTEFLRDAQVWLDGFTGFTAQEYLVISRLLLTAQRVQVNLCLDSGGLARPLDELEVFYPTRDTRQRLISLAEGSGVEVEPDLTLDRTDAPRFRSRPALAHLERWFFAHPANKYPRAPEGLKLAAAANSRAEVEAAAREMTRLAQDRGFRWREMAVLLRDLEGYHQLIAAVFNDYGIPFFLDRKREVDHHPLVELINSAFETVIKGWTYEPLFRCLKTDLIPVSRDEVDRLENYALAHGIKGARWYDKNDWGDPGGYYFSQQEINEIRQRAASALFQFQQALAGKPDVRGTAEALVELLYTLQVPQRLMEWAARAENEGRLEEAQEHSQVWQGVVELLEQLVEALGEEVIPLEQAAAIIESGLSSLRLGLIPPALDQVIVGALDRSRQPEVRAVFLLGVNEGVLPARPLEEGLLTDGEREELRNRGVELAPDASRRLLDEQYLIYQALTRSADYLWVSYPLADEEGRAMFPSMVVRRLRELFPALVEKTIGVEPSGEIEEQLEFIAHPERAVSFLAGRLRSIDETMSDEPAYILWKAVLDWIKDRFAWRERWQQLEKSLRHLNRAEPLTPATSKLLYGAPFTLSVSRLEKYRSCPFAHFAAHGLRLKERELFKLEAPDLGQFFHACLKSLGDRLGGMEQDWGSLVAGGCSPLIQQVVQEVVPRLQHELLLSSARYRYLTRKLTRTVERAALTLAEHARRSEFRPIGLELSFGRGMELPALTLELASGDKMELIGQIDRLDLARTDTGCFLRVIDYKSGAASLDLGEVYHGLSLQLLTYLDVSLTHASSLIGCEAEPGGMLYFPVRDPLIGVDRPSVGDEVSQQIMRRLRMQGVILADPQVARLMDREVGTASDLIPLGLKRDGSFSRRSSVLTREEFSALRQHLRRILMESGQEIIGGRVDISPYRRGKKHACQYCPYRAVCQFDLMVTGSRYRWLKGGGPDLISSGAAGEASNNELE